MGSRFDDHDGSRGRFRQEISRKREDLSGAKRFEKPFRDEFPLEPGFTEAAGSESARDRIRRENEEFERNVARQRGHSREGSRRSADRKRSRSREKRRRESPVRSRSRDGRFHSNERRSSEGMRFEPPPQPLIDEFRDGRMRYSPPQEMEFQQASMNRFSPPRHEFSDPEPLNSGFDSTTDRPRSGFVAEHHGSDFGQDYKAVDAIPTVESPPTMVGKPSMQDIENNFIPSLLNVNVSKPVFEKDNSFKPPTERSFHSTDSYTRPFEPEFQPTESFPSNLSDKIENVEDDAPIIPNYNPETSKISAEDWLMLIDEAARKYKWKKDEKQYILSSRLSGFAQQWYLTTGVNFKSWTDLRQEFRKTFRSRQDFHFLLTKMLQKVKEPSENMTHYFHHKAALLNACEIGGSKAVDCIIAGLNNVHLQALIKKERFQDPDDLYGYLRSLPDDTPKRPMNFEEPHKGIGKGPSNANSKIPPSIKQCFYCYSVGHLKNQCPELQKGETIEKNIPGTRGYSNQVMHGALASRPVFLNNFVEILINNYYLKAYVDELSNFTTIREENADFLKLNVRKQYKVIKAFHGSPLSSVGVVDVPVVVDRAQAKVVLYVLPNHLQQIPVVIGQNFTGQPHIVMNTGGEKIRFYQRMDNGATNYDF